LADLMEKYPKLDIRLKHDSSRKINEQVINLNVDIGIVVNPVKHPDLVIKKIGDDRIMLWQSTSSRLIQDIHSDRVLLICDPDLVQIQAILKNLKKQGLNYSRLLPSNNLEVIAELTASGCGIGILPAKIALSRHLIRVPKTPYCDDEICLLYHGENWNIKAIQVISEAIKKAFKS
jgi:LysR family transcriptional regulator, cell division regulator